MELWASWLYRLLAMGGCDLDFFVLENSKELSTVMVVEGFDLDFLNDWSTIFWIGFD